MVAGVREFLEHSHDVVRLGRYRGEPHYSTPAIIELEKALLERCQRLSRSQSHSVRGETVDGVVARGVTLPDGTTGEFSSEQARAVRFLTRETGDVAVCQGLAGTGKTTMLRAAREAWEKEGYTVIGCALAGRAARELSDGAGIRSDTIHKTLWDLDRARLDGIKPDSPGGRLSPSSVLVIDEAGMVDTPLMARLIQYVQRAGAKVVLVGDSLQLQPIGPGACLRAISRIAGHVEMTEVTRQRDARDREAVTKLARGRAGEVLRDFADRGRLHVADTKESARGALLARWSEDAARDPKGTLILAATRLDATVLNREAQRLAAEAGRLGLLSIQVGDERIHTGDRVLLTKRWRAAGLENGDMGAVVHVDPVNRSLGIRLDSGRHVLLDLHQYSHLTLGYASTTHKAQGRTVEKAFVLFDSSMQDLHLSYVQASRARDETHIFTTRDEAGDNLARLARAMSRNREKSLAHDIAAASAPARSHELSPWTEGWTR